MSFIAFVLWLFGGGIMLCNPDISRVEYALCWICLMAYIMKDIFRSER